jgi:branched-chain amino acid transport system substrate-binding protein
MEFLGIMEFLKKYQAKAPSGGVDSLGYFLPPFAYAELQILANAIDATQSLDDDRLADYMHTHALKTIVGDIAFGSDGEWTEGRPIWVQYHDIKGNDLEQFKQPTTVAILAPAQIQDRRHGLSVYRGQKIACHPRHTGEGRYPLRLWVPASAGTTLGVQW